jgi:hypothetical protein
MTEDIFKINIKKKYKELYDIIYPNKCVPPAKILVLIDETEFDSGYCKGCNTIFLSQGSGNIPESEFETTMIDIWPSWETELIHEMIHQYQQKVEFDATPEGIKLYEHFQESSVKAKTTNEGIGFFGNGHDERFYTAIVKFAEVMNLTPMILKQHI